MKVLISNKQKDLKISSVKTKALAKAVIAFEGQQCDEVSLQFVTTKEISRLHDHFFNDPSTTDCISFPLDDEGEDYRVLGEVFVCPETALHYANSHHVSPLEEVSLYIIHGLLHLMGYDDLSPKDRKEMRAAEKRHLINLKHLNLLL